jgi:YD repeat-containing protein
MPGRLSFYSYDRAGSVRHLTNASGAVTDTYDYDAFGNKIGSTGTPANNTTQTLASTICEPKRIGIETPPPFY